MARQTLTKTTVLGPYPSLQPSANALDITFTAADVANKDEFVMSGNDVLLAWNTDGVTAYYFTVSSVVDEKNRTGDITQYDVGAGEIAAFKLTKKPGWMQSDSKCYIEAENVAIKFAVLSL